MISLSTLSLERVPDFGQRGDLEWTTIGLMMVVLVVALYYYVVKVADRCSCPKRLDGKTVIVTGANTGIGKETARDLARRGARVILACRDAERGREAEKDIRMSTGNDDVIFMKLNLASFDSIRHFAQEFNNTEERLDILINNAGVINDGSLRTEEGHELVFGVNHLGHFLLTNILLDKLQKCAPSRVVNVSSDAYMFGKLDLEHLAINDGRVKSYARSKLANVLFTRQLAANMAGTGVVSFSLHPGSVNTDIKRNWAGWLRALAPLISFFFLKSVKEGAQTSIHCAVSDDILDQSGEFFKGCQVQKLTRTARDQGLAKKLWDVSLEMTGLQSS
ncbi:retinol dehydrogenase 12-like [Lytechinus variegatus]|uniref:retinol dehydrogenase 12-like n=1 Tax=Lytechinus variegatus TaxID=7654 RepID=UPI001BB2C245|nr:retinol dehydrogenase 12-like [Lytechinus variegatus]